MRVQIDVTVAVHLPVGIQLPERTRMLQVARAAVQYMPEPLVQIAQQKFPFLAPPVQRSMAQVMEEIVALQQAYTVCLAATVIVSIAVTRSMRRRKLLLEDQICSQESRPCQTWGVQTISDDEQEDIPAATRRWWREQGEAKSPFRSVRTCRQ